MYTYQARKPACHQMTGKSYKPPSAHGCSFSESYPGQGNLARHCLQKALICDFLRYFFGKFEKWTNETVRGTPAGFLIFFGGSSNGFRSIMLILQLILDHITWIQLNKKCQLTNKIGGPESDQIPEISSKIVMLFKKCVIILGLGHNEASHIVYRNKFYQSNICRRANAQRIEEK